MANKDLGRFKPYHLFALWALVYAWILYMLWPSLFRLNDEIALGILAFGTLFSLGSALFLYRRYRLKTRWIYGFNALLALLAPLLLGLFQLPTLRYSLLKRDIMKTLERESMGMLDKRNDLNFGLREQDFFLDPASERLLADTGIIRLMLRKLEYRTSPEEALQQRALIIWAALQRWGLSEAEMLRQEPDFIQAYQLILDMEAKPDYLTKYSYRQKLLSAKLEVSPSAKQGLGLVKLPIQAHTAILLTHFKEMAQPPYYLPDYILRNWALARHEFSEADFEAVLAAQKQHQKDYAQQIQALADLRQMLRKDLLQAGFKPSAQPLGLALQPGDSTAEAKREILEPLFRLCGYDTQLGKDYPVELDIENRYFGSKTVNEYETYTEKEQTYRRVNRQPVYETRTVSKSRLKSSKEVEVQRPYYRLRLGPRAIAYETFDRLQPDSSANTVSGGTYHWFFALRSL